MLLLVKGEQGGVVQKCIIMFSLNTAIKLPQCRSCDRETGLLYRYMCISNPSFHLKEDVLLNFRVSGFEHLRVKLTHRFDVLWQAVSLTPHMPLFQKHRGYNGNSHCSILIESFHVCPQLFFLVSSLSSSSQLSH